MRRVAGGGAHRTHVQRAVFLDEYEGYVLHVAFYEVERPYPHGAHVGAFEIALVTLSEAFPLACSIVVTLTRGVFLL
jgi:hypothetical protein